MGKVFVNGRPVECPEKKVTVAELKKLGGIPRRNLIYDEEGNVLPDDRVIDVTDDRKFGEVEDFTRG